MPQRPIRLYYWPTPNGIKIAIMLDECGLPYRIRYVNIGAGDQFKPAFLKASPNNRIPAIVDPDGPGGKEISLFESAAILMYLGRKTKKFYPSDLRKRAEVEQWLMWQMGGVGPMAGQAHHFLAYAPKSIPYAKKRYRNEVGRLYGVLDKRLRNRKYVAGEYSIADMAIWPWARGWERQEQNIDDFPNMAAWLERIGNRPAAVKGVALGANRREDFSKEEESRKTLFEQSHKR
jgi:GST-like protein